MSTTLGLLTLALLGAEGAPKPVSPPAPFPHRSYADIVTADANARQTAATLAPLFGRVYGVNRPEAAAKAEPAMLTYQLSVLEMEGVNWRESVYAKLHPVARRGASTVWTAGRDVAQALLKQPTAKMVQLPRVTSHADAPAHLFQRTPHRIVAEQIRNADGPVNHASFVSYVPKVEDVRDGFSATVTGRRLDQGVLIKFVFEESRLKSLHTVTLAETSGPKDGGASRNTIRVPVQVPEIATSEVAGEWLVPNDGVLLVSLGAQTEADPNGKAVVRERLVLLDANPVLAEAEETPRRAVWSKATGDRPEPRTANLMPVLPSRSLPVPHDANGPIPLPPLPEEPAAPTTLPGSSDPCASPQTRPTPSPGSPEPKATEPKPADTRPIQASLDREKAAPPPAAPAPKAADTNEDKLSVTVVFQKTLPRSSVPAGKALAEAAKLFSAKDYAWVPTRVEDAPTGKLPANCPKASTASVDSPWAKPASTASCASSPCCESTARPAKGDPAKPLKKDLAARRTSVGWTPMKPSVFRFPINGAMIEIQVTPNQP